jgi:pyridoxine kinase
MRAEALPAADIATPNLFELRMLTGLPCDSLAGVKQAIAALHALGPRVVLVTSVRTEDTPADAIDMLASEAGAVHRLRPPLLPVHVNGAGDAISALFLLHRLRTGSAAAALAEAGSAIHGLLRRTAEAGAREILTVAAQDEFVAPTRRFAAAPC